MLWSAQAGQTLPCPHFPVSICQNGVQCVCTLYTHLEPIQKLGFGWLPTSSVSLPGEFSGLVQRSDHDRQKLWDSLGDGSGGQLSIVSIISPETAVTNNWQMSGLVGNTFAFFMFNGEEYVSTEVIIKFQPKPR